MRHRPSLTLAICLIASAFALVGLARPGSSPTATTPVDGAASPPTVRIADFAFSDLGPTAAGTTITVANADSAAHTLTARNGEFDTGLLGGGATGSVVLPTAAGTYEFFCELHPSMTGSLTVS